VDQLWAPWRLAYVAQPDRPRPTEPADACFLCRAARPTSEADDRANFVVGRTAHSVVVLNRFPYNNGHLLVSPLAHKAALGDLTDGEALDLHRTAAALTAVLARLLNAEGFNVGLNLGAVAGAGLPGHLHWHVVPRWAGDTNFMPILTSTKVIVQSLDALWELLRGEFTPAGGN
jgi:ATP adenylyltransferase